MTDKYPPINPRFPHFLHGGDYNPDQWRATPEIWDDDMRLMKLSGCNAMSVGIFAWSALEPREGVFTFDWLDAIMDKLAAAGGYAVLATPSGSKPAWMSAAYPEVCKATPDGHRELHGGRHNHCPSSPVYREKCNLINTKLAQRYKGHPALLVWHVSNEFNGFPCYCELCRARFVRWLQERYPSLDELNEAWWTAFWSHSFSDWSELSLADSGIHGLQLDLKRFCTDLTIDFYNAEAAPLKQHTPGVPITTNFMGLFSGLNYWQFAKAVDVVSWDNYPQWHGAEPDWKLASIIGFIHDINRCLKGGKPFMLMESTPSMTNWMPVSKNKRPGMHLLSSLQAVAHGADTVQYFQWRKGRGGCEKFHGAVVDHSNSDRTRVFQDVAAVGQALARLDDVIGCTVRPQVALLYDWESAWALEASAGPRNQHKGLLDTCWDHYRPFWTRAISTDVIDETCDLASYRLVVAPMLYMLRPGAADRLSRFVADGGTLVMTYWSAIADQHDLVFMGGWPGGGLRKVLGVWDEEIDALHDADRNALLMAPGNALGLAGRFEVKQLCSLIHAESASVLATYESDFYAGRPALTVNSHGRGKAYYIACRTNLDFLQAFYGRLVSDLKITPVLPGPLPEGVTAQLRTDGKRRFIFVQNYTPSPVSVTLGAGGYRDLLSGAEFRNVATLDGYGAKVLEQL